MFRYNSTTLKKLENLLEEGGYTLRYEKGSFKPGYCILEQKKVVVVNKFYDKEAKINCLVEILTAIDIPTEGLSDKSNRLLEQISVAQKENP